MLQNLHFEFYRNYHQYHPSAQYLFLKARARMDCFWVLFRFFRQDARTCLLYLLRRWLTLHRGIATMHDVSTIDYLSIKECCFDFTTRTVFNRSFDSVTNQKKITVELDSIVRSPYNYCQSQHLASLLLISRPRYSPQDLVSNCCFPSIISAVLSSLT